MHAVFLAIKESDFEFNEDFIIDDKPLVDWITSEKRSDVWQYVVKNIKDNWIKFTHPRLQAQIFDIDCSKCTSSFVPHFVTCTCRSCIIAGGPSFSKTKDVSKSTLCTRCTFFEKTTNGAVMKRCIDTNETQSPNEAHKSSKNWMSYHLCWAIFKHWDDRPLYDSTALNPADFCVFQDKPCSWYACRIAANIITLTYPVNFSKFLTKNYRPLDEASRKAILTIQNLDLHMIRNLEGRMDDVFSSNKYLHPLHVMDNAWANENNRISGEESVKKASALAEGFLSDFPLPQRNVVFTYFFKAFRLHDSDIEFNIEQLDQVKKINNTTSKQVTSIDSMTKPREDQLEDISTRMNNLKIMSKSMRRERSDATQTELRDRNEEKSKYMCKSKSNILEGEIKKPLVEALQLAASNKKLEAELRSLQKEHSMLKDMVRDLEHIHEEKHQCNHSADESSDSRESKSSHRAEGQCICYYCTIFGQNDCSHNSRVNETRDRLRKRLRKMQTSKEPKAPSLKGLKIAQKDCKSYVNIAKNKPNISEINKGKRIPQQQPTQVVSKVPVPSKPIASTKTNLVEKTSDIQKITPINCAPVDDILKFIEGDAEKREKEAALAKKAAKKKQKQRKLEQKKLSELEELKNQYDELASEENEIRKSFKVLKKRKNKNRLLEAEEKLQNIESQKSNVLKSVSDVIITMRKLNPNFQSDLFDELCEEKDVENIMHPESKPPQLIPNEQNRNCEISVDPSKRMVTIRRINLPHSEPQVTVTAKGDSPDKDQLLYTFINGQLVPGNFSFHNFIWRL